MKHILNPKELVQTAIKIEKNGEIYYTKMAQLAKNSNVKKVMEILAKAEHQHIIDFQKIADSMISENYDYPQEYNTPEIEAYLNTLADTKVFHNLLSPEEIIPEIKSDIDALRHAITFEKDSIIFFYEIYELIPQDEPNRKAVAELIRQEKIHLAQLNTMLKSVQQINDNL